MQSASPAVPRATPSHDLDTFWFLRVAAVPPRRVVAATVEPANLREARLLAACRHSERDPTSKLGSRNRCGRVVPVAGIEKGELGGFAQRAGFVGHEILTPCAIR
jgi:hypothetical protein